MASRKTEVTKAEPKIAYHFVGATLRDGRPVPADGEWLEHDGPIELCATGLHWSADPFDALSYAPGDTLCMVEYDGETKIGGDKGVSQRRRIIKRINAKPLLREFARWSALQVIELWDAPDVVRQYLTTGDESLRAATWAARDAVLSATWPAMDAVLSAALAARDGVRTAAKAARDAALAAALAAARNARDARDAARDAAWSALAAALATRRAAQTAQRERFGAMVRAAFKEV